MRTIFFTVKGSGNFPVSLLCLSECWPANLKEAEKMSYALPTQAREQRIVLATHTQLSSEVRGLWIQAKWPIQSIE